jgi:Ribulose-5-phosphate 4-epimerase and related epimerases and aldolases
MSWPRAVPGIGRDLTDQQRLAIAHRILAAEGWQENLSGHITWDRGDGTIWCTAWSRWWEEMRASDVMIVDPLGSVIDGPWDVTPAVHLHTELHRARPDATVIIHGHPDASTALACLGVPPVISHQNSCIFDNELITVDEYDGTIEDGASGARLAARIGGASGIQLAHHGAIVTAPTLEEACYKATTYERMGRLTLDALHAGLALPELPAAGRATLKAELRRNAPGAYWAGAARTVLRREPDVLD